MDNDQIIAAVKRRAFLVDSGPPFDDTELYKIGSDCFIQKIVPMMTNARESYLQKYKRYNVTGSLGVFLLPQRAAGAAVHLGRYIDPGGNFWNIPRIDDAQRSFAPQLQSPVAWWTAWYFDGDRIKLMPPPPVGIAPGGQFEVSYQGRPNDMVAVSSVLTISTASYSSGTGRWTVTTPTNPASLTSPIAANGLVDVVGATGAHDWRLFDATVVSVSGSGPYTVVIQPATDDGEDPSLASIAAGDYLSVHGQTAVPMCPDELHRLLICEMAYYILSAQQNAHAAVIQAEVAELYKTLATTITPRSDQQSMRVINRFSPARVRRFRTYGGWGR